MGAGGRDYRFSARENLSPTYSKFPKEFFKAFPMTNEQRNLAFNMGCDARFDGNRLSANPYQIQHPNWFFWVGGWNDMDKFWGSRAKWPIRALVDVKEKLAKGEGATHAATPFASRMLHSGGGSSHVGQNGSI